MTKKILLTGGGGFLGTAMTEKLIQNNYDILALSRRKISISSPRLKYIECDLSNSKMIKEIHPLISGIQYVIHAAARMPQKREDKDILSFLNDNINATVNLLEALPLNIRQFVYCSSTDVYGVTYNLPVNESSLTEPNTYYGATKLAGEYLVKIYFQGKSTAVTILRFTQLYGPGEPEIKIIPRLIDSVLREKEISIRNHGLDVRDYLFVQDATAAIMESLSKSLCGVFNVSSGRAVTIRRVIETLEYIVEKKLKVNYLPLEKISKLVFDNKKFCAATNWRPKVSLSKGLKKQYEFARKNFS